MASVRLTGVAAAQRKEKENITTNPQKDQTMPRILIGECKQEVSSFNPVPSSYADFDVSFGDEVLAFHRGLKS